MNLGKAAASPGDPGVVTISSLIPTVAKGHRKLAGSLLHDLGLAPGQEFVLMLLWEQSPQSQADLSRQLMVEPPTTAKALARLEKLDLISRERSPLDRRVLLVSLTDRGRELEGPVRSVWKQLEEQTTAELTDEEQNVLRELLTRLSASFAAGTGDDTA